MRRSFVKILMSIALTQSAVVFAHEGHDKAPGSATAPNGGTIKGTAKHFVEVVYDAGKLKIYVYDHDMKRIGLDALKVNAAVKFPKSNSPTVVKLIQSGDAFKGDVDAKGAHRFSLDLIIARDGKSEKVSFNIEP